MKGGGLSDPNANVFDFGNGNGSRGTDPNNLYALQDEPEINMLKINGQIVTNSDTLNTKNIGITNSIKPDSLKPNITGISPDLVTIEMNFSESVNREDVENYFRITSQENIDSKKESFVINKKNTNLNFYWSEDTSNLKIDINNALLSNKIGEEAKYMIYFEKPFRDSTNRYNLKNKTFRFTPDKINDFSIFSVKNKEIKK